MTERPGRQSPGRRAAPTGEEGEAGETLGPPVRGTALVRAPGPRFADALVTHVERTRVDVALAARQHAGYVAALREAGWRVRALPPGDELPDAPFVEDALVVGDGLAVVTRPGAPQRRAETAAAEEAARELGLEVARIEPPGTLDGGDVLRAGDTVYVGRSARTNDAGIRRLARLLGDHGAARRVVPVAVRGCLHLKTAVTALPDGSLIGVPGWVDTSALPRLRVAAEPAGAHVLPLGGDRILLAASAARTAERLAADGFAVRLADIGEFEAREGGVTCLSVLVPGR